MLRSQAFIGKSNWNSDALLKGSIDDFKIFTRILHPEEIEAMGAITTDCWNG